MSEAKRKRRSFWEPNSKPVVDWLENQTDVSRSIQLAIIDTIAKYGTGDAVEGLINAQSGVTPQPATRPAQPAVDETPQAPPQGQAPSAPVPPAPVEPRETVPEPASAPPTKEPYDPLAVMFNDVNAIKR